MVFKKLSIDGKSYGDCFDEFENPIEITEVIINYFIVIIFMVLQEKWARAWQNLQNGMCT